MTDAQRRIMIWRRDPARFVREEFKTAPDQWQAKVLEAFADPEVRRIAMTSCTGPGKTAVMAWCIWNFLACYANQGEHPQGIALSVTLDNLRDNLWSQVRKWQERSTFLMEAFEWTQQKVFAKGYDATWFVSVRSFPKTASAEEQGKTLSGFHSKFALFVIDESGSISTTVMRAAEQSMSTSYWGKIIQSGNPISTQGMLYAAVHDQPDRWMVMRVTGDPDDPLRSSRVDEAWAREQIKLYGRDNPWVKAYVLGQFPDSSINGLLSFEEVDAAMNRGLSAGSYNWSQRRLGIDPARFGDSSSIIFPRQGLMAFPPHEMRGVRTMEIAARVMKIKGEFGSQMELIDSTGGYGAGVEDALMQTGCPAVPVNFSSAARDPRYFNLRSEIWFKMAEWVKMGASLPKHERLAKELVAPTYTFQGGKLRLEEKDQIKKRLGLSPDFADALAVTFAMPEQLATDHSFGMGSASVVKVTSEYDPFRVTA